MQTFRAFYVQSLLCATGAGKPSGTERVSLSLYIWKGFSDHGAMEGDAKGNYFEVFFRAQVMVATKAGRRCRHISEPKKWGFC